MWRKRSLRLASIIGLLFVFIAAAPVTRAVTESLEVFVFPPSPDQVYKVGDRVTLSIRVFNFGIGADADNLTVQLNPYSSNTRSVNPVHTGVGMYTATLQILASDLSSFSYYGGYSLLDAFVVATIGGIFATQVAVIRVGTLLTATVTASPTDVSPGEAVAVTVLVRADGALMDADAVVLNATVASFPYSSTSTPIAVTHSATGTYTASYTIPSALNVYMTIVLTAEAFMSGNYTFGATYVTVRFPVRLDVWTHRVSVTDTSAVIEVYAANETGWPVSGANVTMRYLAFGYPYNSIPVDRDGTTDRRGRATLNLTFASQSFVTFWGNVTRGTDRAFYLGSVVPNYTPPTPLAFEIRREAIFPFYEVGATATLNYTVLYYGFPIAGQTVYYYAATSSELVANGRAVTDSLGRFQISFVPPAATVRIDFATFVGSSWLASSDVVLGTRPLNVQHGAFRIGSVTHVTTQVPAELFSAVGAVLFVPYNFSGAYSYALPAWLPGGALGAFGVLPIPTGSTFTCDLRNPRFLPKDSDYLFAVELVSSNYSDLGNLIPYVHVERVHITNSAPTLVADLSGSTLGPGDALVVDMSRSEDSDGVIDAYRVDWGDGLATGWVQNATARHVYAAAGDHTVTIQVRDDTGAVASTQRTVHVDGGILGLRAANFFALTGIIFAGIGISVALLVWRSRRRPRGPAPAPPEPIAPTSPPGPPPPEEAGNPPADPPP